MSRNQINISWLDMYQSFLDSETTYNDNGDVIKEEMTEEELYGLFYGSYNQPPLHFANQAWKSHLHNPLDNRDIIRINGLIFNSERMLNSQQSLINIGMRNERAYKITSSILEGVDLIGVLDVITPYYAISHELDDNLIIENYFDSWYWRAALSIANKLRFNYQIFEAFKIKPYENNIGIKAYHLLEMHAYPGMADSVKDIVSEIDAMINEWKSNGNPCVPF